MPDRPITQSEYIAAVAWVAKMHGEGVTTDTIDKGRGFAVDGEPLILVTDKKAASGTRVGRLIASREMHNRMVLDGVISPEPVVRGQQQ